MIFFFDNSHILRIHFPFQNLYIPRECSALDIKILQKRLNVMYFFIVALQIVKHTTILYLKNTVVNISEDIPNTSSYLNCFSLFQERRPYLATECDDLQKAEKFRRQILGEISRKVAQIQNGIVTSSFFPISPNLMSIKLKQVC